MTQFIVMFGFAVMSSLLTVVCSQSSSYPSCVLVPTTSYTDVSFSCAGAAPVQWRVNGTQFDPGAPPPGLSFTAPAVTNGSTITQTLTVRQEFVLRYNGIAFQCSTNGDNFSSVPIAFIKVYSKLLTLSRAPVVSE